MRVRKYRRSAIRLAELNINEGRILALKAAQNHFAIVANRSKAASKIWHSLGTHAAQFSTLLICLATLGCRFESCTVHGVSLFSLVNLGACVASVAKQRSKSKRGGKIYGACDFGQRRRRWVFIRWPAHVWARKLELARQMSADVRAHIEASEKQSLDRP
jgi:hypothetical protein